jgi:hypothetical protein
MSDGSGAEGEANAKNGGTNKVKLLIAGFGGGFLQAGIFNPWDRALYLSIKDDRHFLHAKNFANPFAGVSQTIFQRAISAGMYFPLEEIFADRLVNSKTFGSSSSELRENRTWIALSAGLLAGATNGLLMNPLAGRYTPPPVSQSCFPYFSPFPLTPLTLHLHFLSYL